MKVFMSYNVKFRGCMRFANELTAQQLKALSKVCGASYVDHPEIFGDEFDFKNFDIKLTKDLDGIEWDGTPGTYNMCGIINAVTVFMRSKVKCKNFMFSGESEMEEDGDHGGMIIKIDNAGRAFIIDKIGEEDQALIDAAREGYEAGSLCQMDEPTFIKNFTANLINKRK